MSPEPTVAGAGSQQRLGKQRVNSSVNMKHEGLERGCLGDGRER